MIDMTGPRHSLGDVRPVTPQDPPETVLLIGRASSGTAQHFKQRNASIVVAACATVDAAFLARVAPRAIAFPLIGTEYDAAQILEHLATLDFTGEAVIFAPRLPNRAMVLRELKQLAPGLTKISLLELPEV